MSGQPQHTQTTEGGGSEAATVTAPFQSDAAAPTAVALGGATNQHEGVCSNGVAGRGAGGSGASGVAFSAPAVAGVAAAAVADPSPSLAAASASAASSTGGVAVPPVSSLPLPAVHDLSSLSPQQLAYCTPLLHESFLRHARHQHKEALQALERILAVLPTFVPAWISKGVAYKHLKDNVSAVQCFQRALALDPTDWYEDGHSTGAGRAWRAAHRATQCSTARCSRYRSHALLLLPSLCKLCAWCRSAHDQLGLIFKETELFEKGEERGCSGRLCLDRVDRHCPDS